MAAHDLLQQTLCGFICVYPAGKVALVQHPKGVIAVQIVNALSRPAVSVYVVHSDQLIVIADLHRLLKLEHVLHAIPALKRPAQGGHRDAQGAAVHLVNHRCGPDRGHPKRPIQPKDDLTDFGVAVWEIGAVQGDDQLVIAGDGMFTKIHGVVRGEIFVCL